jgi:hypothetical protein
MTTKHRKKFSSSPSNVVKPRRNTQGKHLFSNPTGSSKTLKDISSDSVKPLRSTGNHSSECTIFIPKIFTILEKVESKSEEPYHYIDEVTFGKEEECVGYNIDNLADDNKYAFKGICRIGQRNDAIEGDDLTVPKEATRFLELTSVYEDAESYLLMSETKEDEICDPEKAPTNIQAEPTEIVESFRIVLQFHSKSKSVSKSVKFTKGDKAPPRINIPDGWYKVGNFIGAFICLH